MFFYILFFLIHSTQQDFPKETTKIDELDIFVDKYEVRMLDFKKYLSQENASIVDLKALDVLKYNYTSSGWEEIDIRNVPRVPDNLPAAYVSYHQAEQYCKILSGRLPTNQEWEFFSGSRVIKGNIWHGIFPYKDYGNDGYKKMAAPSGKFTPNEYGLYDIYGNMWEYTAKNNGKILIRGGSYLCDFSMCTNARKKGLEVWNDSSIRENVGFRCVYDVEK